MGWFPLPGELIGPDTVSTIPPATMDAFRDHGRLRPSLEEDVAGAQAVMNALPPLGISIDAVTGKLVEDGVRQFVEAADRLLRRSAKATVKHPMNLRSNWKARGLIAFEPSC